MWVIIYVERFFFKVFCEVYYFYFYVWVLIGCFDSVLLVRFIFGFSFVKSDIRRLYKNLFS